MFLRLVWVSFEAKVTPNVPDLTSRNASLAPFAAPKSARTFPCTPTWEGTHYTVTLSPSNCHLCHNSVCSATCANGPREPTHPCRSHFAHLPLSPRKTNSPSVTRCKFTLGCFLSSANRAARNSALVMDCFSCGGTGFSSLRGSCLPNPTANLACNNPAISLWDPLQKAAVLPLHTLRHSWQLGLHCCPQRHLHAQREHGLSLQESEQITPKIGAIFAIQQHFFSTHPLLQSPCPALHEFRQCMLHSSEHHITPQHPRGPYRSS